MASGEGKVKASVEAMAYYNMVFENLENAS
jgi:hypothetical protein